ncbi:MAG: hypothetical protein IJ593_10665 [Lachnospiraceae bacterium]|nr:hypothetical protein [Lachnospiraceae bacterium]
MNFPKMPYTTKNYNFHKKVSKSEIKKLELLNFYGIPLVILTDTDGELDYFTKLELKATEYINNGEEMPEELTEELLKTKKQRMMQRENHTKST